MEQNGTKLWRLFILTIIAAVNLLICKGSKDIPVDLILTDSEAKIIVKLRVNGSNVTQTTLKSSISAVSIAYDVVEKRLYWTEYPPHRIRSSDVDGGNVLLVKNLATSSRPYGLAVGQISRKLFYADWNRDVITSMDITGENVKTILSSSKVQHPHQVTVHERERMIIWSDVKSGYKISSSNFDGSDIKMIVTVTTYAFGLAVDEENNLLYWSESSSAKVRSVFLNGTNKRILYNGGGGNKLYDIVLLGNTLYFTARRDRVRRMLINGSNLEVIQTSKTFKFPHGMVAVASETFATESTTNKPELPTSEALPSDVPTPSATAFADQSTAAPAQQSPQASSDEPGGVPVAAVVGGIAACIFFIVVIVAIVIKVSRSRSSKVPEDNSLTYRNLLKDELPPAQ